MNAKIPEWYLMALQCRRANAVCLDHQRQKTNNQKSKHRQRWTSVRHTFVLSISAMVTLVTKPVYETFNTEITSATNSRRYINNKILVQITRIKQLIWIVISLRWTTLFRFPPGMVKHNNAIQVWGNAEPKHQT